MKSFIVLALALVSASAFARPNTQNLSCEAAASLVKANGAIVLSTGDGLYDRFVADERYCASGERGAPAWVPTKDADTCFVGYVCRDRDNASGVVFQRSILKCKEGKREIFSEPNSSNDSSESVVYVCKNGKYERLYGGGSTGGSVKPLTCKEGKREIWSEPDSSNDSSRLVHVVCRSGKWIPLF